jgi:hypothetical protein
MLSKANQHASSSKLENRTALAKRRKEVFAARGAAQTFSKFSLRIELVICEFDTMTI